MIHITAKARRRRTVFALVCLIVTALLTVACGADSASPATVDAGSADAPGTAGLGAAAADTPAESAGEELPTSVTVPTTEGGDQIAKPTPTTLNIQPTPTTVPAEPTSTTVIEREPTPAPKATDEPTPDDTPATPPPADPTSVEEQPVQTYPAADCIVSLSMATGWEWWCGGQPCAADDLACPTEAPGPTEACYRGLGPADGTQWSCDGVVCQPPSQPCGAVPSWVAVEPYPPFPGDPLNCVTTPCPSIDVSCDVSDSGPIEVGEMIVLSSTIQPADYGYGVELFFHHGDGFVDPRGYSEAYYEAEGIYSVELEWHSLGVSGRVYCGDVIVGSGISSEPLVNTEQYIGLTVDAATTLATSNGFTTRIVRIDDELFIVTMDFSETRLNFEIDDGFVTLVKIG